MEKESDEAQSAHKIESTGDSGSSSQEKSSSSQSLSTKSKLVSESQSEQEDQWCDCDFREIGFDEIKILGVIGRGAYGVVQKALWGDRIVAVKMIESEIEKKAFLVEVRQLSRVRHENIVKLYGACTKGKICLIMEYAQHGSLYDFLHVRREGKPRPKYKAGHAISWALQCAKGVDYLHSLKPKPLVHRDLKPPNLLLYDEGRHIKICDFGTACDLHTYMTNNKGSAAWMAPEVFEGSKYSEKCDVFSWGIILWEVLTRRRPFEEIGGPAFRIMWAVHNGQRPPLIAGCPKQLEVLMTRCWDRDPQQRPSMNGIVKLMTYLCKFFTCADEPISCLEAGDSTEMSAAEQSSVFGLITPTLIPAYPLEGEEVPILDLPTLTSPVVVQDDPLVPLSRSVDDLGLLEWKSDQTPKKEVSKGHRRTGSYDPELLTKKGNENVQPKPTPLSSCGPSQINAEDSLYRERPKHLPVKNPYAHVLAENLQYNGKISQESSLENSPEVPRGYLCLQQHLQPLSPDQRSKESVEIFKQHCQMADEYIIVQEEIRLLYQRKQNLIVELDKDVKEQHQTNRLQEEYQSLLDERDRLTKLHQGLKQELEQLRRGRH